MSLADNIKAARASKKLTQKQLAHRAGVSLAYLRELEQGKKDPPYVIVKIAKALEIPVENLLKS